MSVTGILSVVAAVLVAAGPAYEPTTNYEVQSIEGWTVYVNRRLLTTEREIGRQVLRLLRVKLYDINRVVPPAALAELHKVPIWVEYEDRGFPCACYHPSRRWLAEHGYNPDKAGAVEIANAKRFLAWTINQPWMVLHELAHAYHHRVLGHDHAGIRAAYERAKNSGSYESVLNYRGRRVRAYALRNSQEYFAELSEAFFGTNDFYPFVRAEIIEHDPQMYRLLERLWKVRQAGQPQPRPAGNGPRRKRTAPAGS